MNKRHISNQEGQSVVLIALGLVALIAIAGLAIDGGRVMAARRQSQNASDAAAFAGLQVFTARTDSSYATEQKILRAVNAYALNNGIASTSNVRAYFLNSSNVPSTLPVGSNGGIQSSWTGIRVYTDIAMQPFLMGIFSPGGTVSVGTSASAQSGVPGSMDNLMPMTLCERTTPPNASCPQQTNFQFNQSYQLFGDSIGSGSFQWLSFGCASSNTELVTYLSIPPTGTSGTINIGDDICAGPGVMNSNDVTQWLSMWCYGDMTHSNGSNCTTPASSRYWVIPIYDTTTGTGSNRTYNVSNFAVFEFNGWNFQGSNKSITGYFRKYGRLGHVTTPGSCNTTVYNTCAVSLWE